MTRANQRGAGTEEQGDGGVYEQVGARGSRHQREWNGWGDQEREWTGGARADGEAARDRGAHTRAQAGAADWTSRATPDAERMSGQQRAGHEVDGRSEGGARTGQATERSMGRNSDLHLEADDCTHYVVEPKYQALHRGGRRKRASPPGRMAV